MKSLFLIHIVIFKKISKSLGVKPDNKTKKMMRKQKVPRSSLAEERNVGQFKKKFESIKKNFSLHDVCSRKSVCC